MTRAELLKECEASGLDPAELVGWSQPVVTRRGRRVRTRTVHRDWWFEQDLPDPSTFPSSRKAAASSRPKQAKTLEARLDAMSARAQQELLEQLRRKKG